MRTDKFWEGKKKDFPRVILSDTKAAQLYTLDYGAADSGMVLMLYGWENISNQLVGLSDQNLVTTLKEQIRGISPEFANYLEPLKKEDIYVIHWQNDPYTLGAFNLARASELDAIQDMFIDFTRILDSKEYNGVSIIGCGSSFTPGWIEGAFQVATNVTSAILKAYGTIKAVDYSPIKRIHHGTYRY